MNEFEFDRLIELHQKGLLDGRERELVDAWLNHTSPDTEIDFGEEDQQRVKLKIREELEKDVVLQPSGMRLNRWRTYGIAASVLLVMAIGYFAWQYTAEAFYTPATLQAQATANNVKKVILPDGTLVWLKDKSTLKYPARFSKVGTRKVTLEGEALFEVAKDPAHPFVIHAGTFKTTVLGTSFYLKSGNERFELTVFTGKVSLTSAQLHDSIMVLPNEKVEYHQEGQSLTKTTPSEKEYILKDTEYDMAFDDTRIADVMQRLEKKFDVKVSMNNPNIGNCRITADFTDQSLDRTLSMAAQAMNFEYQIEGSQIILSGEGCE